MARDFIPTSWDLPQAVLMRIGNTVGRQRIIFESGHLLLLLQDIPKPHQDERAPKIFWRNNEGVWKGSEENQRGELELVALMQKLEKQLDQFEDLATSAQSAKDWFYLIRQLVPLVRYARGLAQTLQEARVALGPDAIIINARDAATNIERRFDLLHQEANFGLEYVIARRSEEWNELADLLVRQTKRLNVMVGFFLPIGAIAGIFGMNVINSFETVHAPLPFIIIVAFSTMLGALLATRLFTKP